MRQKRRTFGSGNVVGPAPSSLAARTTTPDASDPWLALTTVDGRSLGVRAIEPSDAANLMETYQHLSLSSRRQRFLSAISEYTAGRLDALMDDERRCALVATFVGDPDHRIIATAQFVRARHNPTFAEPALTVVDDYQGRGVGRFLWDALMEVARQQRV